MKMKRSVNRVLLIAAAFVGLANASPSVNAQTYENVQVVQLPAGKIVKERPNGWTTDRAYSTSKYTCLGYLGTDTTWTRKSTQITPLYRSGTPNGVTYIVQQPPKPAKVAKGQQMVQGQQGQQMVMASANPAATTYFGNPSGNCAPAYNPAAPVPYPSPH